MNLYRSRRTLVHVEGPAIMMPAHQRPSFGWPVFALSQDQPARLSFKDVPVGPQSLSLAVAIDVRKPARLAVCYPSGATVGEIDCRYACELHVFRLHLPDTTRLRQERSLLLRRIDCDEPMFCFAPGVAEPAFAPHLLDHSTELPPQQRLLQCLDSLASVTQFGWMEGCVLDGLYDCGFYQTLRQHLDLFFANGQLIYQDFRSQPRDGQVVGTETTNMYATLARVFPGHPAIDACLAFFESRRQADGTIRDRATVGEHNYTVAYTLACIGEARGDLRLLDEAVRQLQIRVQRLWDPDAIWLRAFDGQRTYRNWSRGCAWYLLGMARTLRIVGDRPGTAELQRELADACRMVLRHQRSNGLWGSFIDEPDTLDETSGSAGIAAACAIAANEGWLDPATRDAARRTLTGLLPHVQPDGMLGGMSQSNKAEGAEDLQRSEFRTISATALGLAAQLMAAIGLDDLNVLAGASSQ